MLPLAFFVKREIKSRETGFDFEGETKMSSINLTTFLVYGHAHFMLSLYKQVFTNTRLGEKNIIPTSEKVHSSNKKEQQNAGGNGSEIPFCVGSFRSPYIKCLRILITVCPVFKDLCMFKNN